jgi:outer membrane protein assembly factor BamD (BamD/ComL family)
MRFLFFIIAFSALFLVSACLSGPVDIPPDVTAEEIIQRAQEASDRNRYKTALQYYQALLDRNLTNIDLVCTAEYEIAFIHYKQKKYDQARTEFNELLERYDTPDEELLPQQYKILSRIVLNSIKEKEERRARFFPSEGAEGNPEPELSVEAG